MRSGRAAERGNLLIFARSTTPFKLPALRSGSGLLSHYPINLANDAFTTSRAVGDKLEGQDG